jgi:hypothetical protein
LSRSRGHIESDRRGSTGMKSCAWATAHDRLSFWLYEKSAGWGNGIVLVAARCWRQQQLSKLVHASFSQISWIDVG